MSSTSTTTVTGPVTTKTTTTQTTNVKQSVNRIDAAIDKAAQSFDHLTDSIRDRLIHDVPSAADTIKKLENLVDSAVYKTAEAGKKIIDQALGSSHVKNVVKGGAVLVDKGTDLAREDLIKLIPQLTPVIEMVEKVVDDTAYKIANDISIELDHYVASKQVVTTPVNTPTGNAGLSSAPISDRTAVTIDPAIEHVIAIDLDHNA